MASKRRDSRSVKSTAVESARRGEPAQAVADWPPVLLSALIGLVLLAVLQAAMWYDIFGFWPDRPDHTQEAATQRRTALLLVASPDRLLELWCGGKLEYFSILDRTPVLLAAGAILVGAWMAGLLALELLGVSQLLDRLERFVFATAIGLNLLSLYALVIGLSGGLRIRWLFIAPLAGLLAYGVARAVQGRRRKANRETESLLDPAERRWFWWLLAAAPFAAVIVLGAILPPYEYDIREYHLQVPKEWFQQGRISFLPHNIYGNMPLGSELTALWGMALMGGDDAWWWGALVGKTVMACYSLVTIAGLVAFGRRVHSTAAGVLAAIAYASTPWITQISIVGYNEGPTGLYFLCAVFALWLAWQSSQWADAKRLIGLAGFLAGAAVACKYPPALFLVVPLGGWVTIATARLRRAAGATFIAVAIFATGAAAGCGLWLAKNAALSGNPTYPLLYSMFDGQTRTPEKDSQWSRVHSPQPDAQGRKFTFAQLREQTAWNLWRAKGASLFLLPLALAAWLATRERGLVMVLYLWLLFVLLCWWILTHRLDRFLVPALPLVALLAGIGAAALPHVAWQRLALGLLLVGSIAQFPFASLFLGDFRYFAPLDALRRDAVHIAEVRGSRIGIEHRWLNAHVPPGRRVLLIGDAEPFDLQVPAIYNTCFDDCQFARIFQGRTRAERLAALQAEGISHIFFSWSHLARYRSPGNYGYTSDYVSRDLVHRELVADQGLLRRVNIDPADLGLPPEARLDPELGEIFEVISP